MKKRIRAIILTLAMMLSVISPIGLNVTEVKAKAVDVDPDKGTVDNVVYRNSDGNYIYQTYDKKKTSTTYYTSVALEFSRIKSGVNPNEEPYASDTCSEGASDPHYYVSATSSDVHTQRNGLSRESILIVRRKIPCTSTIEYENGVAYERFTWIISDDTIKNLIRQAGYTDWLAELEEADANKSAVYIGVDAVTIIMDNGAPSGELDIYGNTATYFGEIYTWANWDIGSTNLLNCRGWSSTEGIKTHYNRYFTYGEGQEEVDGAVYVPLAPNETIEEVGNYRITKNAGETNVGYSQSGDSYTAPNVRTYNTDSEFNLGDGIPASEDYTNGIEVDAWYGHIDLKKYKYTNTQTFDYQIKYTSTIGEWKQVTATPDAGQVNPMTGGVYSGETKGVNGKIYAYIETKETHYIKRTNGVSADIERTFTAIDDINLYQLKSTTTRNMASEASSNYYTVGKDTSHVTYDVSINGVSVKSGSASDGSTDQNYAGTFDMITSAHIDKSALSTLDKSVIEVDLDELGSYQLAYKKIQEIADARVKAKDYIIESNDTLVLNGTTYMKGRVNNVTSSMEIGAEPNGDQKDKIADTRTCNIPEWKTNGLYYTKITSSYKKFIYGSDYINITVDDTADKSKRAILSGYEANEPIKVYSPVISPITIEGSSKTQLSNEQTDVTQLVLDETYTVKFDWKQYFSMKGYGYPSGFTKYVKEKYVAFPFSVKVNGVYYEPNYDLDENDSGGGESAGYGYTDYIAVGNKTTEFEVYIPSWSQEGTYGVKGYNGYDKVDRPIKIRCTANNYDSTFAKMVGIEYNDDLSKYVAEFTYPVQVSGQIYGFQVVASNDYIQFRNIDEDVPYPWIYNFTSRTVDTNYLVAERKVGSYNRLGNKIARFTADGTTTSSWDIRNTLPFASGKSNYHTDNGFLKKGTTLAFTLKTIANLTSGASYVKIEPTYRYISKDGKTTYDADEIALYYDYCNSDALILFGNEHDKSHKETTTIGDLPDCLYFKDAYFDYKNDTIKQTAEMENTTETYIKNYPTESYCAGDITLTSNLRLITGNEEELKETTDVSNVDLSTDDVLRYNKGLGDLTDEQYEMFTESMQTWYGEYTIPNTIKVCKKDVNLKEYAIANNGITGEEDFWLDDGYLVLNFKITTYRDGDNEHLSYYAYNEWSKDMWAIEYCGKDTPNPKHTETVNSRKDALGEVEVYDGDIGIIDLTYSRADSYHVGILWLN